MKNTLIEEKLERLILEEGLLDFIKNIGKKFSTAVLGLGKSETDAVEDFENIVKKASDETRQKIKDKLDSLQNDNTERLIKDVFGRIDDRFKNMSVQDIDNYIDNLNNILAKYDNKPTEQPKEEPKQKPQQAVQPQDNNQKQSQPKSKFIKPSNVDLEKFEIIFDKIRPGLRTLSDYNARVKTLKDRLKSQLQSTEFKSASDLLNKMNPGDKLTLKSFEDSTNFIENGDVIACMVDPNGTKQLIFIPKGMSSSPINLIQ